MHEFFVASNSQGSCEFGKANSTWQMYLGDKTPDKSSFPADMCLVGVNHRKTQSRLNYFPFSGKEQKMSPESFYKPQNSEYVCEAPVEGINSP